MALNGTEGTRYENAKVCLPGELQAEKGLMDAFVEAGTVCQALCWAPGWPDSASRKLERKGGEE